MAHGTVFVVCSRYQLVKKVNDTVDANQQPGCAVKRNWWYEAPNGHWHFTFPPRQKKIKMENCTALVVSTSSLRLIHHPRPPLQLPLPPFPITPTRRQCQLLCRRHRAPATSLAPQPASFQSPSLLVRAIELRLNGAADLERRHSRPHAALAAENPVL